MRNSVTPHPGRAFLETTIRLQNKNLLPNRYLLWTNAGVAVTEGSRFVYPMTKTIGHDSSALSTWPVINGMDLSWNKNNKNMLGVFGPIQNCSSFLLSLDFLLAGYPARQREIGDVGTGHQQHESDRPEQHVQRRRTSPTACSRSGTTLKVKPPFGG